MSYIGLVWTKIKFGQQPWCRPPLPFFEIHSVFQVWNMWTDRLA